MQALPSLPLLHRSTAPLPYSSGVDLHQAWASMRLIVHPKFVYFKAPSFPVILQTGSEITRYKHKMKINPTDEQVLARTLLNVEAPTLLNPTTNWLTWINNLFTFQSTHLTPQLKRLTIYKRIRFMIDWKRSRHKPATTGTVLKSMGFELAHRAWRAKTDLNSKKDKHEESLWVKIESQ